MSQTTRQALIDATLESIHRFGVTDTSVATVTAIAGLSRGMVRHCFDNKNAMMLAAYEHLLDRWAKVFFAARTGSPLDRILQMIETMYVPPNFTQRDLTAWLSFNTAALHDREIAQMCRRDIKTWLDAFREEVGAYATHTGKDIQVERVSETILAVSEGLWMRHLIEPQRISAENALEINRKLVLDLLDEPNRD